jgi:hypothetical protein
MPNYVVLEFYLLLLLISVDGEGEGWNHLLHGGSVEDEGDNIGVSIFIDMETLVSGRRHQGGDDVAVME